jgi:ribosomal protein S15P/S13E
MEQMINKKFIVKFNNHDKDEVVFAFSKERAQIVAQARLITNGVMDISIKSIEEIEPYTITVEKFEISIIDNEMTIKRLGEHFNTNNGSERIIFELVNRIKKLETKTKEQKRDEEFIRRILNHTFMREELLDYIADFKKQRDL